MSFEEFENKARLYVLGALDEDDMTDFERARVHFGRKAEWAIAECERLNSMFALSLRPTPPKPATKERLLDMIQSALHRGGKINDSTLSGGD